VARGSSPALVGPVHHVVVDERERVEELQRRRPLHDRLRVRSAARPVGPQAQRGPDPLAARADQPEKLVHQHRRSGSHPRELRAPVGEEPLDHRVDPAARVIERGGDDGRLGGRILGHAVSIARRCAVEATAIVPAKPDLLFA
jgi:hypothetical protein